MRAIHVSAEEIVGVLIWALTLASIGTASTVVIGDSMTIAGNRPWPEIVFDDLVNFGTGGTTYFDWDRDLHLYEDEIGPGDTVWVMLGTVESLLPGDLPLAYELFQPIVLDRLLMLGVDEIVLVATPYIQYGAPIIENEWIDGQRELDLQECADHPRISCSADTRGMVDESLFHTDGIHFSQAGNEMMAVLMPEPAVHSMLYAMVVALA